MLISVTVPTWNREHRLPAMYAHFAAQRLPGGVEAELVVLDDSDVPSPFFAGLDDPRVRYLHDPVRATIGVKRTRLLDLARGEIHVQFDDDDFYAPDYVARTLEHLGAHDFFTYDTWHLFRESDQSFWYWDTRIVMDHHFNVEGASEAIRPLKAIRMVEAMPSKAKREEFLHKNLWGYGFTYAYRAEVGRRAGFPDQRHGSDYQFVKRLIDLGADLHHAPDDDGLSVHVMQSTSTSRCFPQFRLPPHVARHLLALPPGFEVAPSRAVP